MKPDVLVIEPDLTAFAIADRRLREHCHLTWAPGAEAAASALGRLHFDAAVVRAEDEGQLALISRLAVEWPDLPIVAIAPWEVQGDRAVACGAREWISAPINFARLAAVIDFVVVEQTRRENRPPSGLPLNAHV